MKQQRFAVCGTAFHTPSRAQLQVLADALIVVDADGTIETVLAFTDEAYAKLKQQFADQQRLFELGQNQYLLPGLVDLHIHAPQWPQLGNALHLPLYDWLMEYTFPLEAKYQDIEFARAVYSSLVDTLLANGTTTAVYFATIHQAATRCLADICIEKGQRGLIGRVAMDDPTQCPEYYRDVSAQQAIADTRGFIEYVNAHADNRDKRVLPVITPRFIPSCSDKLLLGLGELAREYDCHIQTHCSESDWEHDYVLKRCGRSDTESLYDFGLLTDKTVLAHCNFIDDSDRDRIGSIQAGIAHCPLSNFYFANAVFPAQQALQQGLLVGLGTDISGGHSPSILETCSHVVAASRALEDGVDPSLDNDQRGLAGARINFLDAFWMATVGGAAALNLNVGQFAVGYQFDAVLIDTLVSDSNVIVWPQLDTPEAVFQKIVYNARRCNIQRVWVQGEVVSGCGVDEELK